MTPLTKGYAGQKLSLAPYNELVSIVVCVAGMKGRKSIKVVTMNLSGQSVMGLTPAYKINYIRDYLTTLPDVVFLQDSIQEDDLVTLLAEVSQDKYKYQLQVSYVKK